MYRMFNDGLQPVTVAKFGPLGLKERLDLERWLRDDIKPLGSDLLVIAEEFGNW
jgi:hypothetical protein